MHAEDQLQIAVVQWIRLAYPRLLFWHTPNGGSRNIREAVKLKRMGVLAGIGDLVFMLAGGRLGMIELKTEKGRLSKSQRLFRDLFIEAGGLWVLCRSIDDIGVTLREWEA